jgi:hypothetical protein
VLVSAYPERPLGKAIGLVPAIPCRADVLPPAARASRRESRAIGDDRGLARFMRRFEIGRVERATDAMIGDQIIQPPEAFQIWL